LMKAFSRKLLVLVVGCGLLLIPNPTLARDEIIMVKAPWFELCQEVHEILQLPENNDYIKHYTMEELKQLKAGDHPRGVRELFYIPDKYSNFSLPNWTPVDEEDVKVAIPEAYQRNIVQKHSATDGEENNVSFDSYKALINIDHTGEKETIYKLKFHLEFYDVSGFFSDEKNSDYKQINKVLSGEKLFFYKGRIYGAFVGLSSISINEPARLSSLNDFYKMNVCYFKAKAVEEK